MTIWRRLLDWSEKYTKTDMTYLAKGGFWLTLGQMAVVLSSLGLSIAFANLISPEKYGTYRYILSVFNLLAIPTLLGVNSSLLKSVAQKMDGSIILALKTRLAWGMFGLAGGLSVAGYYLFKGDQVLSLNIAIISLFVPIFYATEVYTYFLRGKKLFNKYATYNSICLVIPTLILAGALLLADNLSILLLSYFIPYTLLKVYFLRLTIRKYMENKIVDPQVIPYGKHLSVMSIFSELSHNLDKMLLWHYLGSAQLAVYALAVSPINNLEGIVSKLDLLIFPKIAQKDLVYLRKNLYRKMLILCAPVVVIIITYIILAPFLYAILFPKYLASVAYSQVFSLTLLSLPIMFIGSTFTAHSRLKEKYLLSFIGPISKISFFLVLIPKYGIWGVIISLIVSQTIISAGHIILFSRIPSEG